MNREYGKEVDICKGMEKVERMMKGRVRINMKCHIRLSYDLHVEWF